jgi:hypothetical protein
VFAEAPATEFALGEAILALVEQQCVQQPVLIAIEDLQWADPSTLVVLHRLGRLLGPLPLVLLCSCRPVPRALELDRLIQSLDVRGATHLRLGPLAHEAVRALVQNLTGASPGPNLLRQVNAAGGNPLFVTELVGALVRSGSIEVDHNGHAEVSRVADPSSLALTILHGISFLSEATVEVLRVASILGSTFSVQDLSLVLARPPVALMPALREAITAGVLGQDEDHLLFRHDVVREALYHDLPLALRTGLHQQAARALADAGALLSKVAEHLMRGASPGDAQAVEWLRSAAREAAPRAPGVAVELLEHALQLIDPTNPDRDLLDAERAVNLTWAGRVPEAEAVCREMFGRKLSSSVQASLRTSLAHVLLAEGKAAEALQVTDEGLASFDLSRADRARLEAWNAHARIFCGDINGAGEQAHRARVGAMAVGDDLTICMSLAALAQIPAAAGYLDDALALINEAVALADGHSSREPHRSSRARRRSSTPSCCSRLSPARRAPRCAPLDRPLRGNRARNAANEFSFMNGEPT